MPDARAVEKDCRPSAPGKTDADDRAPRPRIVHVIDSFVTGGAERLLLRFIANSGGKESRVIALTRKHTTFECEAMASDVPVHFLATNRLRSPATWRSALRLLKEAPADIVHMHLQYSTLLFLPLARFLGLKAVVTLHSPNRKRERWSHRALNRLEVALLRNFADCIIGVGPVVTQAWRDRLGGSTVRTITNAVNIPEGADARPRLDLRAELGTPADSMVFACVASLTPQKNISALIDAFAAARPDMRPIELWLIGDGSQRSALRQKVRDMGPSSEGIRFLGVRDDVDGLLAASDAFVLSSNWEGLPVAMLEAMAHALPVIVPNVGDIATVANSSNAIVTEAGDHDALRRALVRLSQDAGLRTSLGAEARRTVEADYSEAAWLKQLRDLYREIANEGGVR